MGLMQRILSTSGTTAGDGLLKRALELRSTAQATPSPSVARSTASVAAARVGLPDTQKKKPSTTFLTNAA